MVIGWKRLVRKSTRRRRGGTTGSRLAAERELGVQRVEAVLCPLRRGTARTASSRHARKLSVRDVSAVRGHAAELQNPRCRGRQNYDHGSTASLSSATIDGV